MNNEYTSKRELIEQAVLTAANHLFSSIKDKSKIIVHSKPDHTIVMNLDIECQKIIKDVLAGNIPVLAEEDDLSHKLIGHETDYYIVDPIDGTASCRRYLGTEGGQIGYGPMAGYVEKGKLKIGVYFNVPTKTLYSAVLGHGSYAVKIEDGVSLIPEQSYRRKLDNSKVVELNRSAVLFYPGSLEELKTIMYLRTNGIVENTYRLGGFANDSVRIAEGYEQVQLQTRVKAWDFPSTLIALETGLKVIIDPYNERIDFANWVINKENPVLIAHHQIIDSLFMAIDNINLD